MKIADWPVVTPTNAPTTPIPTAIRAARVVLSIRVPTQPSRAGSNVSEPSTIISTPIDDATAMPCTKSSPMRNRPINEMITVRPANSTARPLVSIDSAIASSTLNPSRKPSR
jgi:hypothetical protein